VVVELDDAIDVLVQALPLHRPRDEQFAAGNVEGQELAPLRGHDLADLLGRQPVRPFDHDPIDPDLPSFADPERDADVPVGELLHVGVDLDLEVAFRLVVLLQLLRGATDVDRVVNGPELDVGLLRERVRLDLLVSREDHVTDERTLGDHENQLYPALEVLHLQLHVVEEAQRENVPDVLGQSGGNKRRADLGGDTPENDRFLDAAVSLYGDVPDDDRPRRSLGRGLTQ